MNISGKWIYSEDFGFGTDSGEAVFTQDGDTIKGYLEYTESIDGEDDFTVRQVIEGTVKGKIVAFKGLEYRIVEGNQSVKYHLDNWEGSLTSEGKIVGSSYDQHDVFGVFVLEREQS